MRIFDAHCDTVFRMWEEPHLSFKDSPELHVTWDGLKKTGARVQCFAIYIPEKVREESRFDVALEMIDIFYRKVLQRFPKMKLVTSKREMMQLKDDEVGAILTLEGCDAIGKSLERLRTLFRLGVSSVGLTWNYANAVADGILEDRGAGLSSFGKEVVKENNDHFIWTDVSHLSERGFWEVLELGQYVIASHSNCKTICPNPRNLTDEQIMALIEKDAAIGVTFVPQFLSDNHESYIDDVLRHIEHICALGGINHIGVGSDFDGITKTVNGLSRYEDYSSLVNTLTKYYSKTEVEGFLYGNFFKRFPK
ncbi:membrane dipeptidase [Bacillus tianshenii]|uniref:Membrane dipeptidase n=1 Tax=Sutcliffiella tianshenii TaxID=1463404 RepID=A0ABS2NWL4_9BACI|nr:dipeptidase [Bacillus tianshenii]MBM7619060.1 membrane dipeptidase [Bacillus tianshenii]MCA1320852.1 dipeptidase [Bacillus tianshenii]